MDEQEQQFWGITKGDLSGVQKRLDEQFIEFMKELEISMDDDNPSCLN